MSVSRTESLSIEERFHDGDEQALEQSYRDLGPLVRSYVRRFVPAADVEDIVQVAFFELWRARRRYDPTRSLEGFVLGIAKNRFIDYLRKSRNEIVDLEQVRELVGEDGRELIDRMADAA